MQISNTPLQLSDGLTSLLITSSSPNAGQTLLYGFGKDVPVNWHLYVARINDPLILSTEFGPIWVKTNGPTMNISVTEGLA